jgi:hypothetical protein
MSKALQVKLPNGEFMNTQRRMRIPLQLNDWTCVICPWVLDTCEYDIILRRDWLQQFNPSINWRTGRMTLRSRNQQHEFFPINLQPKIEADKEGLVFLMSAKQAVRKLWKKKQSAWLFFLRGVNADEKEQPQTTNP